VQLHLIERNQAMAESKRALSRRLATEALSGITTPGYSLEAVIRKALRVAALRNHTYYEAWFRLQLLDIGSGRHDLRKVREIVNTAFPNGERSEEVTAEILADYMTSRSVPSRPDQMYGATIASLEQSVSNMEDAFNNARGDLPHEFVRSLHENKQMFNGIKNRVQTYLMQVEADEVTDEGQNDDNGS